MSVFFICEFTYLQEDLLLASLLQLCSHSLSTNTVLVHLGWGLSTTMSTQAGERQIVGGEGKEDSGLPKSRRWCQLCKVGEEHIPTE